MVLILGFELWVEGFKIIYLNASSMIFMKLFFLN